MTWITTDGFLDHFGLESLRDLPNLEDLKASGLSTLPPCPGHRSKWRTAPGVRDFGTAFRREHLQSLNLTIDPAELASCVCAYHGTRGTPLPDALLRRRLATSSGKVSGLEAL